MFEEFYEMYETEEQEVVALINRCIGGGFNWKGNFWEMTVVTLGVVFCDTGKVSTKEERLEWPVTDEERNSEKGWERFQNEQICRLKIRQMKEEWAKDLVAWPWCISEVVKTHEDCPELQAVLDEYHKPVVIQDQVLGELSWTRTMIPLRVKSSGAERMCSFLWRSMLRASPPGPAPAVPPRSCWPTVKPGTRPCGSLQPRT